LTKEPSRGSREPLLTAKEVAERLNLSERTVRRMIKDGSLPALHFGRAIRIRPETLEELIEQSE
jgi:excisionase family DNA binding protein